jgi:hypothetical protein
LRPIGGALAAFRAAINLLPGFARDPPAAAGADNHLVAVTSAVRFGGVDSIADVSHFERRKINLLKSSKFGRRIASSARQMFRF